MSKKASPDFDDATGTWFIAGHNPDHLAQLGSDGDELGDAPKSPSGWSAIMLRLHQLLRRN